MNLRETTEEMEKSRLEWLAQARQTKKEVAALPESIQELTGSADVNYSGVLQLSLYDGDEAMQVCKGNGAEFDKPELSPYSHNGAFAVIGHLDNTEIKVFNLSVPPECHVERESYLAYRYKAVCDETGEEPKPGAC